MTDNAQYAERVVVITGARKGVGQMLANHFLASGAHVIGLSRGDSSIDHPAYTHRTVDVGDDAAVRKVFVEIARNRGGVDIVINNAAVLTSLHAMLLPARRAEEMIQTNFLGVLYVSREAAKLMRKRRWGRIINIGSMASTLEPIGDSVYAASKAASITLTGVLAKEFAAYGITVNTLAVTAFETDMLAQLPRQKVDAVIARLPLARYPTANDITNVIDFFASPRSGYITAQTVYLGGVHG
jgi:3-oxoacyl-[acyl-carrier protein] reductase